MTVLIACIVASLLSSLCKNQVSPILSIDRGILVFFGNRIVDGLISFRKYPNPSACLNYQIVDLPDQSVDRLEQGIIPELMGVIVAGFAS